MDEDFTFENHFSLWLVRPNNRSAAEHLRENVSDEAQWMGDALAVEPRYISDLAESLQDAGFTIG